MPVGCFDGPVDGRGDSPFVPLPREFGFPGDSGAVQVAAASAVAFASQDVVQRLVSEPGDLPVVPFGPTGGERRFGSAYRSGVPERAVAAHDRQDVLCGARGSFGQAFGGLVVFVDPLLFLLGGFPVAVDDLDGAPAVGWYFLPSLARRPAFFALV